jgi:hypothetical protein
LYHARGGTRNGRTTPGYGKECIVRLHALAGLVAITLLGACSATEPLVGVSGTWTAVGQPVSGSGLTMSLAQVGGRVTGNGTQFVEAGQDRPFAVAGTYGRPHVALQFTFADGAVAEFTGTVRDGHMTGIEVLTGTFTGGDSLDLARQ